MCPPTARTKGRKEGRKPPRAPVRRQRRRRKVQDLVAARHRVAARRPTALSAEALRCEGRLGGKQPGKGLDGGGEDGRWKDVGREKKGRDEKRHKVRRMKERVNEKKGTRCVECKTGREHRIQNVLFSQSFAAPSKTVALCTSCVCAVCSKHKAQKCYFQKLFSAPS